MKRSTIVMYFSYLVSIGVFAMDSGDPETKIKQELGLLREEVKLLRENSKIKKLCNEVVSLRKAIEGICECVHKEQAHKEAQRRHEEAMVRVKGQIEADRDRRHGLK
jgi:hypothetical protein